jgi:hypothetical protein
VPENNEKRRNHQREKKDYLSAAALDDVPVARAAPPDAPDLQEKTHHIRKQLHPDET